MDHPAGTILYLELGVLLGTGARCVWRDSENSTFAPIPYGRSVLEITFGYVSSSSSYDIHVSSTFAPVPYGRSVLEITFGYGARVCC